MKVLFLKGGSRNDVLRILVDKLAHEFSLLDGVVSDVIDLVDYQNSRIEDDIELYRHYDVLISFNGTGDVINLTGKNGQKYTLFSLLSMKQVFWMVDDPVYHIEKLQTLNPNRLTIFTSDLHINTARSLGFDGFFAQSLSAGYVNTPSKPHSLRRYDIAIAASWMGEPEAFWTGYDAPLSQVIEETISCVEQAVVCNAYPLFSKKLAVLDLALENTMLIKILSQIHSYIRKKDRLMLINDLINTGRSVALIGSGWRGRYTDRDNITYFEDTHYTDINRIYEDARVVANLNAENGASERVFDGIESGAMIFSDFSNALYQIFSHDQGVLFYQKYKHQDSINALLCVLDQNETERLAQKAQSIVTNGHTWAHRAKDLYHLLQSY